MDSLEEKLFNSVTQKDINAISYLLSQGANPNKITSYGKTSLGEACAHGHVKIVQIIIDSCAAATKKHLAQLAAKKKHKHKRKSNSGEKVKDTLVKSKNKSGQTLKENKTDKDELLKRKETPEKSQGSSIFAEGTSAGALIAGNKSVVTSAPTPKADLEWDEEAPKVAPSTSEDESWTSMYKWYAAILECTGAALASPTVTNGINQQDAFMRTPLHYAADNGHTEIVQLLIEAECILDVAAGDGLTPLHMAVMRKHYEIIQILLDAGSQVNYRTHEKMTALHFAASRGLLNVVKMLTDAGADIEAKDTSERTAIYLAAGRGHVEVVKFLVSNGANVNGEEIHGYTPLCEAVWHRFADVVDVLLVAGARVTHSHKLLHNAIEQSQVDMVGMLAHVGGGINMHYDNGDTPLLLAVRMSQPAVARKLLESGANVNSCNSITGATALHIAVESLDMFADLKDMVLCLLEKNIDLNVTALTGDTALNRALLLQKDHAAMLLIRQGCNVNACDLHACGLDNLSIAKRRRSNRLANLLIKAGHRLPAPDPNKTIPKEGTTKHWVYQISKTPLSLYDKCRIKIRQSCDTEPLYSYVDSLPLPKSVKSSLMLEDEQIQLKYIP